MDKKVGIIGKAKLALESYLDQTIEKAQTNTSGAEAWPRKALMMVAHGSEQQAGWIEKRGMVGPDVLKSMARKDSVVLSIHRTRLSQISAFAQPQKDKYSPGFKVLPKKPASMTREDKVKLANPDLEDEEREKLRYDIMSKLAKEQQLQEDEMDEIEKFILHCGMDPAEMDTDKKRVDFDKFVKLIGQDTLIYNHCAIEKIPQKGHKTKGDWKLHSFYPVSAHGIKYVSSRSAKFYQDFMQKKAASEGNPFTKTENEPYKYLQVVRGKVEAAWTDSEMVFEPRIPSVDPEDLGYAPGELELLIQMVTAHLYAEAHNRNFFTQGLGTKGLLHIKGDSISQAQLEGFKRQWFSQVVNTKNAFRPPIIGLADEVKWVSLAATNKDMEFDNWMHYIIKIICAVYQIDPAEINFDISKINTSTLNETSNEQRIKSSRDKGLKPLLDYIENIINRHIIRSWNPEYADKYEFKFVGLDAETRVQEADRLEKEVRVWKTINEARMEQGKEPVEHGDVVGNAVYTQYLAQMEQAEMQEEAMAAEAAQGEEEDPTAQNEAHAAEVEEENKKIMDDLESELQEMEDEDKKKKEKEQEASLQMGAKGGKYKTTKDGKKEYVKDDAKKSLKVEYFQIDEDDDE